MTLLPITSTAASRSWDSARSRWEQSTRQLASMRRIQSAADDPAGLAIATRLASHIGGERIVRAAAMDGLSMAETADGAIGQMQSSLQRMRELALQSRNGTLSDADRSSLDKEYQQLGAEVQRVMGSTRFNGQRILSEEAGSHPISTGTGSGDTLDLKTPDLRSDTDLAAATGGSIDTAAGSTQMLDTLDKAMKNLGDHRAGLGASMRRLEAVADTAGLRFESASRAYDRLTGANPWAAASQQAQSQVQQYAAIAMLRQPDARYQQLLSLFG